MQRGKACRMLQKHSRRGARAASYMFMNFTFSAASLSVIRFGRTPNAPAALIAAPALCILSNFELTVLILRPKTERVFPFFAMYASCAYLRRLRARQPRMHTCSVM